MKKTLFILVIFAVFLLVANAEAISSERTGRVIMEVSLNAPPDAGDVKLWVPYPVSDENQTIEDVQVTGNFANTAVYREGENGNVALYAEWKGPSSGRILFYSFTIKRKEAIRKNFPGKELVFSQEEFRQYLKPTSLGPTTGKVRETAAKITRGKKTNSAKARAIYDWMVNNMHRDPNVKGCGYGDVEQLLVSLGGKCGDLHAVFVSLARSVGIPAREINGIRLPKGNAGDLTKAQHCWAEYYAPGYGWVPVDPSDVRKAMLEKRITDSKEVKDLVEYFFGAVDENRVAYQSGKDILLSPAQKNGRLAYFMYPYAEADGKTLNEDLFGFNIGYKISFKEI